MPGWLCVVATLSSQSDRTRPIFTRFVFSPEVTCNRKMARVRRSSMSERSCFCYPKLVRDRFGGARGMKRNVPKDIYSDEGQLRGLHGVLSVNKP